MFGVGNNKAIMIINKINWKYKKNTSVLFIMGLSIAQGCVDKMVQGKV